MPWDRVHDEAEVLEHVLSGELERLIAAHLGDPDIDPHGDPIPTADFVIAEPQTRSLDELADRCPWALRPRLGLGPGEAALPGRAHDRHRRPSRGCRPPALRRPALRPLRRRRTADRRGARRRDARPIRTRTRTPGRPGPAPDLAVAPRPAAHAARTRSAPATGRAWSTPAGAATAGACRGCCSGPASL